MTKTLFDFCTLAEGTRDTDTICVTARARFGNTADPERRMEERLLRDSEYTLLRGGNGFDGILRLVNVTPARSIDEPSVRNLYENIPEKHRRHAVFMLNAVTLREIYLKLGHLLSWDASDGFRLMNVPVLLSDSMPCAGEGKVPVLFGDFSQIRIEDCGRDDLLTSTGDQCVMTGYMNCRIVDKEAISGIKII